MNRTSMTDIRTVGINVRDQDAAIAFYRDTLGFEIRLDVSLGPNQRWITVTPAKASATLALIHGPDAAGADTGIRFAVPDAGTEQAFLRARGVDVGELLRWPGVPAMFTFKDPDNNVFYVVEDAQ